MKGICEDCGEPIYNLGCSWCNEIEYIKEIDAQFDQEEHYE